MLSIVNSKYNDLMHSEYALIVAGGKGTRIKSSQPKQFLDLNGKPVLLHTLEAFYRYAENIRMVLVLPEDDFDRWRDICTRFHFTKPLTLKKGGGTRFQSVKNGLEAVEGPGLVAIHDGVRPLVSTNIIGASFRLAAMHQSAVAAVGLKESIRMIDQACQAEGISARRQDTTKAVDRSRFRLIQTPQTFDIDLIKQAYQIKEDPSLTDDASVVEKSGHVISLFEGSYDNIKITTAEDFIIAEALLNAREKNFL
jgi:2-C-methyl-D-erythritol 4-phosphate cytidylyltransferase